MSICGRELKLYYLVVQASESFQLEMTQVSLSNPEVLKAACVVLQHYRSFVSIRSFKVFCSRSHAWGYQGIAFPDSFASIL